jgi:hypothetical protein
VRGATQRPTDGDLFDPRERVPVGRRFRSRTDSFLVADLELGPRERKSASLLSHVEAQVAAAMRRGEAAADSVLVINNVICKGQLSCRRFLPGILESGQRLTVWETEPDGTLRPEPQVFVGTGERIKR